MIKALLNPKDDVVKPFLSMAEEENRSMSAQVRYSIRKWAQQQQLAQ